MFLFICIALSYILKASSYLPKNYRETPYLRFKLKPLFIYASCELGFIFNV